MKIRLVLILFLSLYGFSTIVHAQDCGDGLPCGPIPWSLPSLPELVSPTPLVVTVDPDITPTATNTPTVAPTRTPVSTSTPFFETAPIEDSIATMGAVLDATEFPIANASGTPMGFTQVESIVEDSNLFWSYAKGLTGPTFGPLSPLINVILFGFVLVLFLALFRLIIPVLGAAVGLIRKAIELVLGFLPG